jgi:hypothetical protein
MNHHLSDISFHILYYMRLIQHIEQQQQEESNKRRLNIKKRDEHEKS